MGGNRRKTNFPRRCTEIGLPELFVSVISSNAPDGLVDGTIRVPGEPALARKHNLERYRRVPLRIDDGAAMLPIGIFVHGNRDGLSVSSGSCGVGRACGRYRFSRAFGQAFEQAQEQARVTVGLAFSP